ncbi:cyclic peptide export ABC transporter [Xenorhabdus bovienii]|uniref:Cyclic peptide transporter n=1 Tax=Xenorhabdus bovienii str. kraussei Becker Underwood TaxID=1398204 RepID=A0A077Q3Z1_XENBV|nr:cyclic peptide export ABC transporter [Xenorhabdus bovienii]CDH26804.1 Cyclic peptide transporter [Xenorhabdus bovienii str. kraussei Becker Underwood]
MGLFREFSHSAPNRVLLSVFFGAFSGVIYALLIPLTLSGLDVLPDALSLVEDKTITVAGITISNYRLAFLFAVSIGTILLFTTVSEVLLIHVGIDFARTLRKKIYQKINRLNIADLERIGLARITAILTTDISQVIQGAKIIPTIIISMVMVMGMMLYLYVINDEIFFFILKSIAFGLVTYQFPIRFARRYLVKSRSQVDELRNLNISLTRGAKELKLDRAKRHYFHQNILNPVEDSIAINEKKGQTVLAIAVNYGDLLSFFVIGFTMFIFGNYHSVTNKELIAVIMTLLYITAPISVIINNVHNITLAAISMRKVKELISTMPAESTADSSSVLPLWQEMVFDNVEYEYLSENNDMQFSIGPVNFALQRGELVYIVGGNGCGKSTLAKLITHHYLPTQGMITIDGLKVDDMNREAVRQHIGCIYSDYHLFDSLLIATEDNSAKIEEYLENFGLAHKVRIESGRFSTTSLSDGQRKRLALLAVLLDDKGIYLFDEWAADQDPEFKRIFYEKFLPDIKSRGKTVVVITHDDHYFHLADRVFRMDSGMMSQFK